MPERWTEDSLPDLTGKVILVTGGNSGIGWEASRMFAARGAHLVLACRSESKARDAIAQLRKRVKNASAEFLALDLASLASVERCAQNFTNKHDSLDVLVNNAGVMALPARKTEDGMEMQMGTNHFGHFALTGRLLDTLLATGHSRIVTVSSGLHARGQMRFDDLMGEKDYDRWGQYSQSKLANLLFAYELQRRLEAKGSDTISVGCHPGYAATNLQAAGPRMDGSILRRMAMRVSNVLFAQSAAMGALPTTYAATHPDLRGGEYIGPPKGWKGYPDRTRSSRASHSTEDAARLWKASEELTGVRYSQLQ